MENNGFIVLYRKILDWEWFQEPKMVTLWICLLLLANHEDGQWKGIQIKRGQLITGLHSLKKHTGISIHSLRTCINRLKSTGELTIKSTNKYSIITIIKYDDYQGKREKVASKVASKVANKWQTSGKQVATNNNDNNENNILPATAEEEFDFNKALEVMRDSKRLDIQIIALYWTIKGFTYKNKISYEKALRRDLRAAGQLVGYTTEQLTTCMKWHAEKADYDWKLETIHKNIDSYLAANKN